MQLPKQPISYASPIAELYEHHAAALFAFLRPRLYSREDAEDILVEIFVAAIEYPKFARMSEKEQHAWLWRVARNKVIDQYRRSQLRQNTDLEDISGFLEDNTTYTPEQVVLRREEYATLHTSLEQLPALQQEVMRLRFANELRYAEIATILGRPEGAIRVMLSRAIAFLRTIYEQEEAAHGR